MLYSLYFKNDIIGLFNSKEQCENFVKSLEKYNFAKVNDFYANEYHVNSLLCVRKITFDKSKNLDNEKNKDEFVITNEISEKLNNSEEYKKIKEEEKKIYEKKKEIEKQKEKIKEMKNMFEVDKKLYEQFKQKLDEENSFEVPILFRKKYKLLTKLEKDNSLNFESFMYFYDINEKDDNSYSQLFESDNHENSTLEI